MNNNRREFLKKSCSAAIALTVGGAELITSCTNSNVNPFTKIIIDDSTCKGCGECLESCYYDAILLPQKSIYSIIVDDCTECGKCKEYCDLDAFAISTVDYLFDTDKCVGCGDCIDECESEGNCISYEKEDYTVRGKCKIDRCHLECVAACPEDAITITDHAIIDMDKCTRCGECIAPCPRDAINPAKIVMNAEDCNHCGKCYLVCDWEVIERGLPDNYAPPEVLQDKCTSCGDCVDACEEHDAINIELYIAEIDDPSCRDCGKCLDYCRFDSIRRE